MLNQATWRESRHGGRAAACSGAIHVAFAAAVLTLGGTAARAPMVKRAPRFASGRYLVALAPAAHRHSGGGGGQRDVRPASLGRAPRAARRQFAPPLAHANQQAKLLIEPALVLDASARLPDVNLPDWDDPFGQAGPPSGGPGSGGGIGSGREGGSGPGDGPGAGPGSGGGMSGWGRAANGSPLVVLHRVDPEYSDQARKAKLTGTVVVKIVVDEQGRPRDLNVVRPLGLGLDEAALDAVRQWRFRAATRNGTPYATTAFIEVNFRLL